MEQAAWPFYFSSQSGPRDPSEIIDFDLLFQVERLVKVAMAAYHAMEEYNRLYYLPSALAQAIRSRCYSLPDIQLVRARGSKTYLTWRGDIERVLSLVTAKPSGSWSIRSVHTLSEYTRRAPESRFCDADESRRTSTAGLLGKRPSLTLGLTEAPPPEHQSPTGHSPHRGRTSFEDTVVPLGFVDRFAGLARALQGSSAPQGGLRLGHVLAGLVENFESREAAAAAWKRRCLEFERSNASWGDRMAELRDTHRTQLESLRAEVDHLRRVLDEHGVADDGVVDPAGELPSSGGAPVSGPSTTAPPPKDAPGPSDPCY